LDRIILNTDAPAYLSDLPILSGHKLFGWSLFSRKEKTL
jgi:hypothetical protein